MINSDSPLRLPKSQHRLNTVRLSQALATQRPGIPTGIADLDCALDGGIVRGQITEIYGCPGSGKTSFGLHLAALIIKEGHAVVWLQGSQCIPASRLHDFIAQEDSDQEVEESMMQRVQCIATPTLTSLLTLLLETPDEVTSSTECFITKETRLLVLDDLTTLYNAAFPPSENQRELSMRKTRILTVLANKLTQIATIFDIAVVILSKFTSKITRGGPAQMEGPFGDVWNNACSTRIVLYRDHYHGRLSQVDEEDLRWVAVQKAGNQKITEPQASAFKIVSSGLVGLDLEASQPARTQSSASQRPLSSSRPFDHNKIRSRDTEARDSDGHSEGPDTKRARTSAAQGSSIPGSPEIVDSEEEEKGF